MRETYTPRKSCEDTQVRLRKEGALEQRKDRLGSSLQVRSVFRAIPYVGHNSHTERGGESV